MQLIYIMYYAALIGVCFVLVAAPLMVVYLFVYGVVLNLSERYYAWRTGVTP